MRAILSARALATALLALLAATATATATAGGPPERREPPPANDAGPQAGPPGGERGAEDLEETLEIYMIAKMKRELSLTRDQEEKVVPLIQDLTSSRQQYRRARRLDLMRLRPLVEDPSSSEDEIRRVVSHMAESESSFRTGETKILDQVRAALSPRQQGKFIFFQERFRREMMERLRQLREDAPQDRSLRGRRRTDPAPLPGDE